MKKTKFFHPDLSLLSNNDLFLFNYECATTGDLEDRLWARDILIESIRFLQYKNLTGAEIKTRLQPFIKLIKSSLEASLYQSILSMIDKSKKNQSNPASARSETCPEVVLEPRPPVLNRTNSHARTPRFYSNKSISRNDFDYNSLGPI